MNIPERIAEWEREEGPATLRACGLEEGMRALDFAFGRGHWAVAAANALGPLGRVTALDRDMNAVDAFRRRVEAEGIGNIEIVHSDGSAAMPLADASVDFAMLYDILHFEKLDRRELVGEARRVLRKGGVLSVLPFHFDTQGLEMLLSEIGAAGFSKPSLIPDAGLHLGMLYSAHEQGDTDFDGVKRGTFYNFARK
jgi:ubiquinone/menaquinone biosynthesis C-methylase UbiE